MVAALAAAAAGQELPVAGIAGVGVMTSNLEQARQFYSGALGFSEAFSLKDERGRVVSTFFKVNDEQYIQVTQGPYGDIRMAYVAVLTPDLDVLRKLLLKRGVIPSPISQNPDGSLASSLKDPDGARIEFVARPPGSLQAKSRGQYLSDRRISRTLWHAGLASGDLARSAAFYSGKLGFQESWRGAPAGVDTRWVQLRIPGQRGDVLELTLTNGSESYAFMQHICLIVPAIRAAIQQLGENGFSGAETLQPRFWRNGRR